MLNIIAETAFSHEGDFNYLLQQIKKAYLGEVDFIKFQVLLDIENYLCKNHPSLEALKKWTFSQPEWLEAFNLAKELNLKVIALPLTINSLEFCFENTNLVDAIEVHSVSLNEHVILDLLSSYNKTIILGIGGYKQKAIDFAMNRIKSENIILMHGFQSFPTKKEDNNIGKINSLSKTYKHAQLGFADHSVWSNDDFIELCQYAFFCGARYIEKHIVIEKGIERIDSSSAIESNDFIQLRKSLNTASAIFGEDDINSISENEFKYYSRRKRIFAQTNLNSGTILNEEHFDYRVGFENQNSNETYLSLVNRELITSVLKDEEITFKKTKHENH